MSAIQQLLTDHIDIWTAAETEKKSGRGRASGNAGSVYGIKKLRELILELAVRGKLVPQNTNDEPASELLKRIQAEKTKLIAEGKIKKDKPLAPITEDEKPFELPKGWERVRLGSLFDVVYGKGLANSELTDEGYEVFGANGIIGRYSSYLYSAPQLLISCRGAYSGKPNISPPYCFITSNTLVLQNSWNLLNLKFFFYSLTISDKEKIVTGSAQPQVTTTNLDPFIIVLPPLTEQHRIVAKVDELMALCDQLENQHSDAAEAHEKLVSHLLGTLTQSQNAEDFSANWQRIAAHFDTLFTTDASIDALKQTLLQLAVMGKLVPQDANDEPASELLKRIQAEKAKLIAEGKIKKDKPLAAITDDEKPFELPQGWEWARFGCLSLDAYTGLDRGKSQQSDNLKYPYFKMNNILNNGGCDNSTMVRVDAIPSEIDKYSLRSGDFLFNTRNSRELVGKTCVIRKLSEEITLYNNNILRSQFSNLVVPEFIDCWFRSSTGKLTLNAIKSSTTNVCAIYQGNLFNFLCPIPSSNEQHRIVAKVDELMALCDQLKSRITDASRLQQKLADVLVEQAVA